MRKKNQTFMINLLPKIPEVVIDTFNKEAESFKLEKASIEQGDIIESIRKSKISWVDDNNWFIQLIYGKLMICNKNFYGFELTGWDSNACQFTLYDEEGSHYKWHVDIINKPEEVRKLTIVTALSDLNDYQGGALLIKDFDGQVNKYLLNKGESIVFPSILFHKVTKVKKGVRKSLVGWAIGPRFK